MKRKKKNPTDKALDSVQELWETSDEIIPADVLGSYTGIPMPLNYDEGDDLIPQQDQDDL